MTGGLNLRRSKTFGVGDAEGPRWLCRAPDCHVHQHPPPTNGLIWPPPTSAAVTAADGFAASSLMPNRPARGNYCWEGEGAGILRSNLNM